MDATDALPILEALACGNDPISRDPLPDQSILHHPQIVRALFTALRVIESQEVTTGREIKNDRPSRAGDAWDEAEDKKLADAFHAGQSFTQLAKDHQRSRGAIYTRLARLGFIDQSGNASSATLRPSAK